MAKHAGVVPADEVAKMFKLDLKNRALAAFLAWLVPGLGHLYQGRTAKGLLFMICIWTTFLFGFYLGAGKVAYATPKTMSEIAQDAGTGQQRRLRQRLAQAIDRWPFLCQAGIGTVALPAVIERHRFLNDQGPLFGGWFRPPSSEPQPTTDRFNNKVVQPDEQGLWNFKYGFYFELGTIYTVIAGLLNILVVYDAYSGPLVPREVEEEVKEDDKKSSKGPPPGAEAADKKKS